MPSLFSEHELTHALKRISAAKSADQISASDARVLRDRLDQIVKDDEKRHGVEAARAAKRERALNDPSMLPTIQQINASLGRLGIDSRTPPIWRSSIKPLTIDAGLPISACVSRL
jgi:hypothetical protein